jgi:lipooligosaccharide transport system ATP-binding protein
MTTTDRHIVEIKQVYKKYGELTAVNGVSLDIKKGECFGLLGPNGAGKSTLMKMMYGSSLLSEGELYVLGLNVKKFADEIKTRIGVVPQDDGLDTDFSVSDNLRLCAEYNNIKKDVAEEKIRTLLRLVRLEDQENQAIESLSGGMRRRLALARGLVNSPEVLFLDEPTTGLDPQARLWIWDFFKNIKQMNGTVILTTHYMEEAEQVCDRIAIMDHGKILALGTPRDLIREHVGVDVVEFEANSVDINYYLGRLKQAGLNFQTFQNTVCVMLKEGQKADQVLAQISSDKIVMRKPSLNDVFLKLAGHHLRDS